MSSSRHLLSVCLAFTVALAACGTAGPASDAGTGGGGGTTGGGGGAATGGGGGDTDAGAGGGGGGATGGGGGLSAGPGQFNFRGEVNGQSIAGTCTPKNSDAVDSYSTVIAGNQLNIGCPGAIGTALANPAASIILKSYAALPATFTFNAADGLGANRKYELAGWVTGTGPRFTQANGNVQSIEVNGTYDGTAKRATGTVLGRWGATTKPMYEAEGWLEIAFDVTHP